MQGVVTANGNTSVSYNPNSSRSAFGSQITIAAKDGKYYFECKVTNNSLLVVGIVNLAWSNIK